MIVVPTGRHPLLFSEDSLLTLDSILSESCDALSLMSTVFGIKPNDGLVLDRGLVTNIAMRASATVV